MPRTRPSQLVLCSAATAALLLWHGVIARSAMTECASLPGPILYGVGASNTTPLIAQAATRLANAVHPVTIVYQDSGACRAAHAFSDGDAGRHLLTGTASYWSANGMQQVCTLPSAGMPASFAAMPGDASPCGSAAAPLDDNVRTFLGPISTLALLTPAKSSQKIVSDLVRGYWPDASSGASDTRNVRDGHSPYWSSTMLLTATDHEGRPEEPSLPALALALNGRDPVGALSTEAFHGIIDAGFIPRCAMRVTRTSAFGPLAAFDPVEPCGCAFESYATGSSPCAACEEDADCKLDGARACRLGYCERR